MNTIRLDAHKVLTVDPHPNRPGAAMVHIWIDGMEAGFFELNPKTSSQLVCQLMDAFAATTVPA